MTDVDEMFYAICNDTSYILEEIQEDALIPTRYCAVCDKKEFEKSIVGKNEFWLCDGCLAKLKKLLKEVSE